MSNILFKKVYPRENPEEPASETDSSTPEIDALSAKAFFDKLEASITLSPLPGREEGAQQFIEAAMEISAFYGLDIEVRRLYSCISIDLGFDIGSGLKGLNKVFGMADEFGFATGIKGRDVTVTMQYYTHAVYLNGRQVTP